jgi:4-amino-4-deoxy-L-arabinose transferase-like glycosyltransferase
MNVEQARRAACGVGVAWAAALTAVAVLLAVGRYESRDADSALHAAISSDLARRPFHEWIAPEWNGHWTLQGLYREHPAGVFLFPAVVARLGYPSAQAAYAVNAIYQILTLWLMLGLARQFLSRRESRVLVTLLLLLPIAFTYRIRANHEQPLLMCLLAACYGIERSRSSLRWAALSVAGFAGLFLVKGVFVAVAMAACAAWLSVRQWRWPEDAGQARPWIGLAIAGASLLLLVVAYEAAYASVVGEGFFPWYSARQSGVALATSTAHPVRVALYSFSWYLGRIAWFTAPWSLAALVGCWRGGPWLRRAPACRCGMQRRHALRRGRRHLPCGVQRVRTSRRSLHLPSLLLPGGLVGGVRPATVPVAETAGVGRHSGGLPLRPGDRVVLLGAARAGRGVVAPAEHQDLALGSPGAVPWWGSVAAPTATTAGRSTSSPIW